MGAYFSIVRGGKNRSGTVMTSSGKPVKDMAPPTVRMNVSVVQNFEKSHNTRKMETPTITDQQTCSITV
jgi:hypothetical protein